MGFLFMNLFCSEKPPPTDLYHPLIEGEKMGGFLFFVLLAVMISGGCATSGDQSEQAALISDRQMVLNRTWQWVATVTPVEKITVSTPERYTIRLTEDGKVQARFDCNQGGGNYEIFADKLSFGPLMSTRMACSPDSLDAPFMRDLQRVASFFIKEGNLYLELPFDSGTMRFRLER